MKIPPPLTPPHKGEGVADVAVTPSPLRGGVRGGGKNWNIAEATRIADGIGGKVWSARTADGIRAIVKSPSALALTDGEPPRAVDFMRWRDGHGCARLLDTDGDLQLLEFAGGRTLLSELETTGDDWATEIACNVLAELHAPSQRPAPPTLQPLRDYFRSLFVKAGTETTASQFTEAATIAERLLAGQRQAIPLHGDIHHENILSGPRGWLAIDPKGLIGDPTFDAANLFYNPIESELRYDADRVARMSEILSQRLDIGRTHLLDWAFAFSALSASWHMEDGNTDEAERSLGVGRAVDQVRLSL